MKKSLVFLGLIFCAKLGLSQQITRYSLYNQNLYMLNPAVAGSDCNRLLLHHKNQWLGINNSPKSFLLAFDAALNKHGIGIQAQSYSAGLLKDFQVEGAYAYHLNLSNELKMSAGLSLGVIQQSFMANDAIASDYSDAVLTGGNQSELGFTSSAGIYLYGERFDFGLSVPRVFSTRLIQAENSSEYNPVYHMTAYARYWLVKNDNWGINLHSLYKNAQIQGNQVDFGSEVWWKNSLGLGAIYRTNGDVCGVLNIKVKDFIAVSYAYDFSGGRSMLSNNGSHEIALNLKLCKAKPEPKPLIEPEVVETDPIEPIIEKAPVEDVVDSEPIDEPDDETPLFDLAVLNERFNEEKNVIIFEFDDKNNVISNNQKRVVDEAIEILKAHPELKIKLHGHSCNMGSESVNMQLSKQRAETIKNYMLSKGVSSDKVEIKAHGESNPIHPNTSAENRQKNRAVIVHFME